MIAIPSTRIAIAAMPDVAVGSILPPASDLETMIDKCVNILHITDIHLLTGDFAQNVILAAFLEDLERLKELRLEPDLILISGDLARRADEPNSYAHFLDLILKMTAILGLNEQKVLMCPGNHDVSRNSVGPNILQVQQWHSFATDRDRANELQNEPLYKTHVFKTFAAYADLAETFAQDAHVKAGQSYSCFFFRELGISVVSINTATLSVAGMIEGMKDERRLVVPEKLLVEAIGSLPKDTHVVVLGHHPTSWLNEANEDVVRRLLGKSAHMYLSGHLHAARPENISTMTGTCFFGQSGALYEWRDRWNGYAIYSVVPKSSNVKAHYRRWYEDRRSFSKAEDLGDDGIVFSPPDSKHFFEGLRLKINRADLEKWRIKALLPDLEDECNKTLSPVPLEESFVPPDFEKDLPKPRTHSTAVL
ncbi:metallophosphoesterase [Neorhizobium galegae]|nr:metallophosphoesterase [Neorhizobium galegae]